jgi:hypothetical protein
MSAAELSTADKLAVLAQDVAENDPCLPELTEPMTKTLKVLLSEPVEEVPP